jgi:two-component system cell cycle response regulator
VLAAVRAAEDGDRMGLRPAIARAVSLSREALAEALAVGDGWCARLALNNIADYSMHVDDIDTAATALAQVAGLPGQPTLRCRTHHGLAQGRLQAARGELESAYEIFTACIEEVRDDTYMELKLDCLNELTRVLERMGRFEAALQTHRDYHNVYVRMASEGAQRMARLAAQEHEIEELRDAVGHAQSLASTLVRSNAELAREAERLLRTNLEDSLTGLPNRRRFEAELAGLAPGETGFACAMLDVDHFKQVNDRYSHVIGDAVLRKLGEIFTRQARQDDVLARFGGEEFALLIRAHDPVSVRQICERLRGAVEDADWAGIQAGLAIRLSVGFALGHEAGQPELVMKLADERLYAAKRAGRNQVIGPA